MSVAPHLAGAPPFVEEHADLGLDPADGYTAELPVPTYDPATGTFVPGPAPEAAGAVVVAWEDPRAADPDAAGGWLDLTGGCP